MGKVMMPGGDGGAAAFLNLALKAYLQNNLESEEAQMLSKCVHSDKVSLYLADMRLPEPGSKSLGAYDLVAVNEKGQTRAFQLQCDGGLQVKAVSKVPMSELSSTSKEMFEALRSEHLAAIGEDAPVPASPKMS